MPPSPPDHLPTYRLLTGPDDAAFCRRVSEALAMGYELYGSPCLSFNGQSTLAGQAVRWPGPGEPPVSEGDLLETVTRMEAWLQATVPDDDPLRRAYGRLAERFAVDLAGSARDVALARASALMVVQALRKPGEPE